ncbi:leucine-rich repeat domain-containing glycoprotein 150 [Lycorma delicatula]|uniref:leucine-rich repeat domain-containing glycoprotein 150 n=1 Tax=Lycorma delicatula TaxID=130591 RepID=UPI003F5121DD
MEFLGVLLLCTQLLWSVQAVSNCPKECKCIEAGFGGSVAHCEQLNINQTFSTSFHHLNVTDSVPEKLFTLESKFFQKLELEELQTIKIINSSLSFIDKSAFDGMNSLNYLDLSDNLLTEIDPDTFINNDNLQQLSLSGNPLQNSIKSNYILKSRSLTDLDLSRCQLRQITSETFNELLNLRSLNLGSNFIHFLSQNMFEKLEFLEEINLSSNLINDLDQKLFLDIEDLTTLKLSNNSISKFDDVDISSLRELDLSYNIFKMLESTTLDGALDVTNVNFSHNMIERIDEDTFTDCNRLRYLDLSYNSLKGPLPESMFETNTELETLSLAHNPHLGIFDGFKGKFIALYRLDLSYCGLVQLEEKALVSFQYLSTLDLSGNLLTDLHPETFSKLSHLNNLDLSDNQLTTLNEDIFLGNMDLRKLILKGNRIHHLSAKLFQPVVHLNRLDVSKCHLNYLWNVNESIYMKENNILSQLDYLSLEGNKLKTMHKHIFESMNNLKTLDISKNPFQCDEQFVLVIEWLVQQKITPTKYIGKSSADMEHELAGLHWADMLSKICSSNKINAISEEKKHHHHTTTTTTTTTAADELIVVKDNEFLDNLYTEDEEETLKSVHRNTIPEIDYTSNFGLVPEHVMDTNSVSDSEYPWIWPLFIVLICGVSILLALFNLAALILYRSGRNYKVAGYRSTFITPLSSHMKIRRDAGSFYHKLYEECSVPNSVPIVKNSDEFLKSPKKNTIIISGATKGEDMV